MSDTVRIAAIGDLHCTRKSQGAYAEVFRQVSEDADVLVLCGDLTDFGLPEEAHILAEELRAGLRVPAVAVLGNHDYESGHEKEVHDILLAAGVTVLDGDACEVEGIGFAGVKGFCGGFGDRSIEAWGEQCLKQFVQETVHEALKLESALARLHCETRVAVLHYAPIEATVRGEPLEIYPFLGSRRLEEPLQRFPVAAVFHGHCHYGSLEGTTAHGAPVYNVAMPLLRRARPGVPAFRLVEVDRNGAQRTDRAGEAHVQTL
jgi:Icc-related predicted phosphoesterase